MVEAAPSYNPQWLAIHWDDACKAIEASKATYKRETTGRVGATWPYGFVLAPNQETKTSMGAGSDDINATQIVNRNFSLLGCIQYNDQFEFKHTTRFCFSPFTVNRDKGPGEWGAYFLRLQ